MSEEGDFEKIDLDLSLPLPNSRSPFEANVFKVPKEKIEAIEDTISNIRDTDSMIQQKITVIENLDICISIVTYKVYDATYIYKTRINEMKEERNTLLTSIENKSELSLILHDLDEKIVDLSKELQDKIAEYNHQKIEFQQQMENTMSLLDEDVALMQALHQELKLLIEPEEDSVIRPQITIVNQKYVPVYEELRKKLTEYQHLQLTGWKVERSEEKLSQMLEQQGLKFTPSGRLLTRAGDRVTFEEAQQKGYFKQIDDSLGKVFEFFQERDRRRKFSPTTSTPQETTTLSESVSTIRSEMCSEDVKYLKRFVGKPLTLALAEITAKQPRDPIHYLAHYLFKYRYNQELAEIQKKEIDELTRERKIVAEEIWKKFIEEEARNAVIEMILRAEEIALQNELKRIEQEQMEAEEEWENEEYENLLKEEARDKFE